MCYMCGILWRGDERSLGYASILKVLHLYLSRVRSLPHFFLYFLTFSHTLIIFLSLLHSLSHTHILSLSLSLFFSLFSFPGVKLKRFKYRGRNALKNNNFTCRLSLFLPYAIVIQFCNTYSHQSEPQSLGMMSTI